METDNLYSAPQAELLAEKILTSNLAGRGRRLGAHVLDYIVFYAVALLPIFIAMPFREDGDNLIVGIAGAISTLLSVCYLIATVLLLSRRGQTVGKRLLKIKIVRDNDDQASGPRLVFLRFLAMWLIYAVPLIGPVIVLVNIFMIFGERKKCLHDLIADTKVIEAT